MRLDRDSARGRFEHAAVAHLATVSADAQPHLVPIVFALAGDTIYTAVDAKPKTSTKLKRLGNIATESKVAVLVDFYDEDWSRLWWSRADGRARVVDGIEAARAIGLLVARHVQYATSPPPGPVIAVDVQRWTGWAASQSPLDA